MGVVSGVSAALTFFALLAAALYWLFTSKEASQWIEKQEHKLIETAVDGTEVVRSEINQDIKDRLADAESIVDRQRDRAVRDISGLLTIANESASKQLINVFDRADNFGNKQRAEWFAEARNFMQTEPDKLVEKEIRRLSDFQDIQMDPTRVEVPGKPTWHSFVEGLITDAKQKLTEAGQTLTDEGLQKLGKWAGDRKAHVEGKVGLFNVNGDVSIIETAGRDFAADTGR